MAVAASLLSESIRLNPTMGSVLILSAIILYFLGSCLYSVFWHPLAKIPGPRLYGLTVIPYYYHLLRGDWHAVLKQVHDHYGPVVRIGPKDVSFTGAEALKGIYGHKGSGSAARTFQKDRAFYGDDIPHATIFNANNDDHKRIRRLLSHAFSEKALQSQEDIMKLYVDMFIDKLTEQSRQGNVIDITEWYNFATFDLVGHLAFGEPLGCLEKGGYHPWVSLIFGTMKQFVYRFIIERLGLGSLTVLFMPKHLKLSIQEHREFSHKTAEARIARDTQTPDFLSYVLRHNDEKGMVHGEILELADVLVIAGSETTATLLSGTTYFLLRDRTKYDQLVREIRSEFQSEDEITIARVNQLSYTVAVLNEGLRMYPPVPFGLPRKVPSSGDSMQGYWLPDKASITHWATFRSENNFTQSQSFIPERWLGDSRFDDDKKAVLQPFSVGPRNCIGKNLAYAESRLLLVRLLWKFDLELMSPKKHWDDQLTFVMWDKKPLQIRLTEVVRTT
ncbi:hypothetical protein FZEAL_5415 [Fusarium zealandicum]|uniref:Cytochrome P450 monooxygenase n=1 Tax=Fusarium zealandicum TaxID=1053134 RepID=A0A8H4UJR4_9HYPO|nr:hypothetical protein FZEAL_5415 [Fusarium zealandicum]